MILGGAYVDEFTTNPLIALPQHTIRNAKVRSSILLGSTNSPKVELALSRFVSGPGGSTYFLGKIKHERNASMSRRVAASPVLCVQCERIVPERGDAGRTEPPWRRPALYNLGNRLRTVARADAASRPALVLDMLSALGMPPPVSQRGYRATSLRL